MSQSIEIWQFCWFFDTYTSFGANLALGKFGLGKYGSGQIWPGQTWVWENLASGKFGSGQTWAGAKVAGQTWSGKIWFGQTWDVIGRPARPAIQRPVFWQETTWTHVPTLISEKIDFSTHTFTAFEFWDVKICNDARQSTTPTNLLPTIYILAFSHKPAIFFF